MKVEDELPCPSARQVEAWLADNEFERLPQDDRPGFHAWLSPEGYLHKVYLKNGTRIQEWHFLALVNDYTVTENGISPAGVIREMLRYPR